jgi:hypothetical protein
MNTIPFPGQAELLFAYKKQAAKFKVIFLCHGNLIPEIGFYSKKTRSGKWYPY